MHAVIAAAGAPAIITKPSAGAAWPAFVALLPDGDDVKQDCAAFIDMTDVPQGRLMRGDVIERRGVQIIVRSKDPSAGYRKMQAITARVDAIDRLALDFGDYLFFIPSIKRGVIISMGQDTQSKKLRYHFALHVDFICNQEGPYEELTPELEAEYTAKYSARSLVPVDYNDFFPA